MERITINHNGQALTFVEDGGDWVQVTDYRAKSGGVLGLRCFGYQSGYVFYAALPEIADAAHRAIIA